jgi:hypothetical protein
MQLIAAVTAATTLANTADTAITAGQDCTPSVTVTSLTAATGPPTARIALEDSADGITWATLCQFDFTGPIRPDAPITVSQRVRTADAIRAHVRSAIHALNDTVSYSASV